MLAAVNPGTRLGPYEVIAALGKGGMGEVYRARDTRIDRAVALKVLPEEFFESEERRGRFEREAKLLASLNHPGIATLYSFEEIPGSPSPSSSSSSTRHLLVMELIEGETLSARLAKGPLPLDQMLRYGAEVARALDAAHRRGIVHRDLKPGNVMLTKSGVKILDFGLARAIAPEPTEDALSGLTTQDKSLTVDGGVVGTLPYMAPEQLEGRPSDARTDIFALGATLYEMAAGRRPFHGANTASLISAILTAEPASITSIRPAAPAALDRVVSTCLAKGPDERWQSAADVARELEWIAEEKGASAAPRAARSRSHERLALGVAALAVLVGSLSFLGRREAPPAETTRFKILAPPGESVLAFAVLSPDSRKILLQFIDDVGKDRLAIRSLDSLDVRFLPGTDGSRGAFWSPDGREVGFFADGKLKRMSADGGPARAVCDSGAAVWGAWSREGTILFATHFNGPLNRVAAAGGALTQATALDAATGEVHQNQPCFLPDSRHYVYFSANADFSKRLIRLGSLESKETRPLFEADSNAVFADGYLIFARDDAVLAWRFDPKALRLVGEPFPAFENVHWASWDNFLSLSAAGSRVAYVSWALRRRLEWVDRKGRDLGTLGGIAGYADLRISRMAAGLPSRSAAQPTAGAATSGSSTPSAGRPSALRPGRTTTSTPPGSRTGSGSHTFRTGSVSTTSSSGPQTVVRRSSSSAARWTNCSRRSFRTAAKSSWTRTRVHGTSGKFCPWTTRSAPFASAPTPDSRNNIPRSRRTAAGRRSIRSSRANGRCTWSRCRTVRNGRSRSAADRCRYGTATAASSSMSHGTGRSCRSPCAPSGATWRQPRRNRSFPSISTSAASCPGISCPTTCRRTASGSS